MSQLRPASKARYGSIDALRGVAMVWMTIFHFCFDLSHFGWWPQDFRADPVWTWQRTGIVTLFIFCAGLGQAVAHTEGIGWRRFGWRWGQIAACALLVTLGSWWMFPSSFIYFGVLHGMAVMLIVARLTAAWGMWLLPAGLVALLLPLAARHGLAGGLAEWAPWMDGRGLNWLGLVLHKPFTEDYVPLFPWLGVMWWGLASGQWLLRHRRGWLSAGEDALVRPLAALGRWSLSYYMVHQPAMIGALMAITWLLQRAP